MTTVEGPKAMATALWAMKPVQMAAKSLAAGTAVALTMWAVSGVSKTVFGDRTVLGLQLLSEAGLNGLQDEVLIDIMARLLTFRRFAPTQFDRIYNLARTAVAVRFAVYKSGQVTASKSFAVRKSAQQVIEATRVFRAILERKLETALEDFDEIAVDLNARLEQVCTDAVQDYNL